MSCHRCSIGLSQFRLLQNVPGTSARRRELNSQGVTGNGPKIVHRQPPGQGVPLVSSPSGNSDHLVGQSWQKLLFGSVNNLI